MKLNNKPFNMIKNGRKNIELRLYDEKRRNLKDGETISVTILALHKYESFAELYKHFDKASIGYEDNEFANPEDMNEYYTPEKQKQYGVVGIEIALNE